MLQGYGKRLLKIVIDFETKIKNNLSRKYCLCYASSTSVSLRAVGRPKTNFCNLSTKNNGRKLKKEVKSRSKEELSLCASI